MNTPLRLSLLAGFAAALTLPVAAQDVRPQPVLEDDAVPVSAPAARGLGGAPPRPASPTGPVPVARSPRTAVTGGHAWTDEQDEELRDGLEAGVTVEELALHLELAPDLVTARINQLGLEVPA